MVASLACSATSQNTAFSSCSGAQFFAKPNAWSPLVCNAEFRPSVPRSKYLPIMLWLRKGIPLK